MVVDFRVTFDEEVSDEEAASILKNAIKDGKLGSFKVDSTSVKSVSPTAGPRGKYTRKYFLFISDHYFDTPIYTYMGLHDLRNVVWSRQKKNLMAI